MFVYTNKRNLSHFWNPGVIQSANMAASNDSKINVNNSP